MIMLGGYARGQRRSRPLGDEDGLFLSRLDELDDLLRDVLGALRLHPRPPRPTPYRVLASSASPSGSLTTKLLSCRRGDPNTDI
jgi:hypothetical protein